MSKYYVMQMFSGDFSPIFKYTTTEPTLAFAIRDDLAKQYPEKLSLFSQKLLNRIQM